MVPRSAGHLPATFEMGSKRLSRAEGGEEDGEVGEEHVVRDTVGADAEAGEAPPTTGCSHRRRMPQPCDALVTRALPEQMPLLVEDDQAKPPAV